MCRQLLFGAIGWVGLALFLTAACPTPTHPQASATWRSWNQPTKPLRIIGNIYYVGANEITSFLIVTPAGDILLDGGFPETARQIEANIKTLGFHLSDVKILLNSHAHVDHAGGLSALKRDTGAALYAGTADAPMLASGDHGDFFFGDRLTFPPAKPDRLLRDNDTVDLGGTTMTAHITPGHTKGCTTWTMTVPDDDKPYHVVFVCSASVLQGIKLVGNDSYPSIADDYAQTFRTLRSLPCDVFLASHGSFFDLAAKREALARGVKPNPFVDPQGYRQFLDRAEADFQKELDRQQALSKTSPHSSPPKQM
jgi:metallo-beta-lactamase class B